MDIFATGADDVHREDRSEDMFTLKRRTSKDGTLVKRLFEMLTNKVYSNFPTAIEAVIALMDDSEVSVFCEEGRYTTAEQMVDKVAQAIGLDENHKSLFTIWVVSGALRKSYFP